MQQTLSKRNQAIITAAKKGYTVKDGVPYSLKGALKTDLCKGRPVFGIRLPDGIKGRVQVSRFVAYMKYGDKIFEPDVCVYHKDGDITNSSFENILIGSRTDAQNSKEEGKRIYASAVASSFITKYDHSYIIDLYRKGNTYKKIMEITGIKSKGTISFIIKKSQASLTDSPFIF